MCDILAFKSNDGAGQTYGSQLDPSSAMAQSTEHFLLHVSQLAELSPIGGHLAANHPSQHSSQLRLQVTRATGAAVIGAFVGESVLGALVGKDVIGAIVGASVTGAIVGTSVTGALVGQLAFPA